MFILDLVSKNPLLSSNEFSCAVQHEDEVVKNNDNVFGGGW